MARETQKALKCLREAGYLVEVVEKTIPKTYIKKDLYGFIDILAVRDSEILGVQVTSNSNFAARRRKIEEHENMDQVLRSGIKVEVWGFKKGSTKPRIIEVTALLKAE